MKKLLIIVALGFCLNFISQALFQKHLEKEIKTSIEASTAQIIYGKTYTLTPYKITATTKDNCLIQFSTDIVHEQGWKPDSLVEEVANQLNQYTRLKWRNEIDTFSMQSILVQIQAREIINVITFSK